MMTSPDKRIAHYTEQGWWGQQTLHSLLRNSAKQFPDHLAVADQPNRSELTGTPALRLSYAELDANSDYLATQLLQSGVCENDVLVVQLPNIVELVVLYFAISKIGAIISPVPIQYGEFELQEIINTLNPKCLVTIDQFKKFQPAKLASTMADNALQVLGFGKTLPGNTTELNLPLQTPATVEPVAPSNNVTADSIMSICWTSGTTGTPKGVPRSHNMWLAIAHSVISTRDYHQGDRLLNPFPMVNMGAIGSFIFPSVLLGCSLILHHPLDAELFLQQMQDEKITFTIAPPALLNQLAQSKAMWEKYDFSSLTSVGSGSAPLAPWMVKIFSQDYGVELINFYGSNEGICLTACPKTVPNPEQRAVLFPRQPSNNAPGNDATGSITKVLDTHTGEEITEPGVAGELAIDGPTVFDGYYGIDNSGVFTDDGFFRTGDLVEICGTPPHFYQIVGRCKDIINRGGMKVSPSELDRLLEGYPDLKEVAVCGFPDERLGEKICVCIVPQDQKSPPTLDSINRFLIQKHIANYKLPEKLAIFDQLPRNPMGKVQRFELQDQVSIQG